MHSLHITNQAGKFDQKMSCLVYRLGTIFYFSCIFFIFLFHEWACKEGFMQTLVKNTHEYRYKNNIGIYIWVHLLFHAKYFFVCVLFFMNSNQLLVLLNLHSHFFDPQPAVIEEVKNMTSMKLKRKDDGWICKD